MAVPKKKTSKSKRGMRRAHQNKKPINIIVNKETGAVSLPGHIASDGTYGGKVVAPLKEKKSNNGN